MRDIEKLGGLPAWFYQGIFSVKADAITKGSGLQARGFSLTLREMRLLSGSAALGQVTWDVMAISTLGGFQGSAKVLDHLITFYTVRTDLQRFRPTSISVIPGTYFICFLAFFGFSFLSHFAFKEGKKDLAGLAQ